VNDFQPTPRAQQAAQWAMEVLRRPRVLAALGAGLGLVVLWRACSGNGELRYVTEEARRGGLVVTVTATGTLQPINQVDVGSELSGTMRSVEVDFNDPVRKDQVIARLDTTRLEAQVLQSEAALAAANARVEQADASRLEAEAQLARLEHVREISGGKVPSAAELDTARATAASARAEVASTRAAVAQARATLEAQRTDLGKAEIRSPIDGIVLRRSIEPGQTVAASLQAPILFTLAEDLTHMELLVAVDEADVSVVAEGQPATFTVDAWPGRSFDAEVVQVRYGADALEGVVTYGALLRVDNPDRSLRPGMTATAEVTVKRIADALLVPNAALRFSPPASESEGVGDRLRSVMSGRPRFPRRESETREGGPPPQNVYRLRGGSVERIELRAGATDGRWTEVLEGDVAPGDALAVDVRTAAS
jgi:HlyD family secretion protein